MSAAPALALALSLAGPARPQDAAPAAPTASTSTAAAPAEAARKPALARALRVKVHKEARDWEPVSVEIAAGALEPAATLERRISGKKGLRSRAKAVVRAHPAGEDTLLIVSIFADELDKRRVHVEARLKIVEGFLEHVEVAAVTAQAEAEPGWDSRKLRLAGAPFSEEFASEAALTLAAVDPAPTRTAFNAGRLRARFGLEELGLVSIAFAAKGVNLSDKTATARTSGGELPGCPGAARPDVPVLLERAREAVEARDFDQAYESACRAARVGDPASAYIVATILRHGYGRARPRDMKLALLWYARAAVKNHAPSAAELAALLRRSSPERAQEYLRQASRLGHAQSQAALGASFRSGRGERQDNVEAYRWYWLARKAGFEPAARALDELAAEMSEGQVDEARRRAELLLPAPRF